MMKKYGKRVWLGLVIVLSILFLSACGNSQGTKVGSIVTLGKYGDSSIEWVVLEYDEVSNRSVLISKYGLDTNIYMPMGGYGAPADQSWEKSSMRAWLNNEFWNEAFSENEKEKIALVTISTTNYQGEPSGNDTQDHVYLLSCEEVEKYFEDPLARRAVPTSYAVSQGAKQYDGNDEECKIDGEGCCWWWLRSPGNSGWYACDVRENGYITNREDSYHKGGAVRPVIQIDLNDAN